MAFRHRVRHTRTEAPIAPPVEDPRVCRWCREKRFDATAECFNGCAPNDQEERFLTLGQCQDCGAEFRTGRPLMDALLCHGCDRKDAARQGAYTKADGRSPSGFLKSEISRGASRRAFDAGKDQ